MEGFEFKELQLYTDSRGWLGEIIRDDESALKPMMSYLSMTLPGMIRGPHEHRVQTDYFCFVGRFRVYVWDNRETSPTFGNHKIYETSHVPTIAVIAPGIVHAYKNIGDGDGLVINYPDKLYKGRNKNDPVDEVRYEDDPDSPFRIVD